MNDLNKLAALLLSFSLALTGCRARKETTIAEKQDRAIPVWPKETEAPPQAPNIVLILVDDVGFSTTSTFGGAIQTPNFDRLAEGGLRYNNFHVNALCSPSRASLLSGRNSHQLGFGDVAESAAPFPGYNTLWPKTTASIAEVLKRNGYSTAAFGKWHNTPTWQVTPVGPYDRWPTGLGFQHFYGFLAGYDNQYHPRLFEDTVPVEPPDTPQEDYNFNQDITGHAVRWLHEQQAVYPNKPFFLYYAPGATHMPHQVQQRWIEKYKGKFDGGWDVLRRESFERQKRLGLLPANARLTPPPAGLPAWDSLSASERKLLARQMEVYAAFTEQTDDEIGRLLQAVHDAERDNGKADNTLVIEIFGDNGASAEGGPAGSDGKDANGNALTVQQRLAGSEALGSDKFMNQFAAAWAWALSSPFQGVKMDAAHLGGTTDPMVISWPKRIHDRGGLRNQFQHLNDIAPTLYEAAGITPPQQVDGVPQLPLEGSSLLYTIDHPQEPSHHHVQYFATLGNLGIYQDGWWAGRRLWSPWDKKPAAEEKVPWELYNLRDDYSQANDLAQTSPAKLEQMKALFAREAQRNLVNPIFPSGSNKPGPANDRMLFTYRSGVDRLPDAVAPHIVDHDYTITADVDVPSHHTEGVLIAQGSRYGGLTLYLKKQHLVFEINAFGNKTGALVSSQPLKPGKAHIVLTVVQDPGGSKVVRPGRAVLTINGVPAGEAAFVNLHGESYTETLDIGCDLGSPVSTAYESPYRFKGTIDSITVSLNH